MDEDQDRIYVGSKDHILSLNINNISQEPLSIFWPASANKVDECKMAGKDPTQRLCLAYLMASDGYHK
uniref:Semaphorin-3C n=1 Tax=Sphaerodactylus townsendi TaxID=933632 RepID=A0ACB8FRA0_9SAUR